MNDTVDANTEAGGTCNPSDTKLFLSDMFKRGAVLPSDARKCYRAHLKFGRNEMDLGIAGKRALVCASSKGLGRGCAEALAAEGVHLVMNARGGKSLEDTAAAIRARHGVEVVTVAADITTEEGRA